MRSAKPRHARWFKNPSAAKRLPRLGERLAELIDGRLFLLECDYAPEGRKTYGSTEQRHDVHGRSFRHIDRLARDWIGHGVSPTRNGGRGARKWSASGRGWKQILASWPLFTRAERRAARVVVR